MGDHENFRCPYFMYGKSVAILEARMKYGFATGIWVKEKSWDTITPCESDSFRVHIEIYCLALWRNFPMSYNFCYKRLHE